MKAMHDMFKLPAVAIIGLSALAFSGSTAMARVVCDDSGDCWHSRAAYDYPPSAHIIVHPDDWKWGPSDHYRWREHEGKGYWSSGEWKEF